MRTGWLSVCCCLRLFGQAEEYNPIYRGDLGQVVSSEPNAFLMEMVRSRKPGRALDVGMGQGRNSFFLAKLGWEVTGIDLSDEGVRQARTEAVRRGLKIDGVVADFHQYDFGQE